MSFIQRLCPNINPKDWQDRVDEYGWFNFDREHEVAIGENDAAITGINETGDMAKVTIGDESDSVHLKFFSQIILDNLVERITSLI